MRQPFFSPETYLQFFRNSEIVLSLPSTSGIFGGTSCIFGGITAQYKLPARIYVGVSRDDDATEGALTSFEKADFQTGKFLKDSELEGFFLPEKPFFKTLGEFFPGKGFRMRILSESPSRESSSISFLAVAALSALFDALPLSDILSLSEVSDHLEEHPVFRNLLERTLKLRLNYNCESKGKSSMVEVFAAIPDGTSPRIHQAEKNVPLAWRSEALAALESRFPNFRSVPASSCAKTGSEDLPFEVAVFDIGLAKNRFWPGNAEHWNDKASSARKVFEKKFTNIEAGRFFQFESEESAAAITNEHSHSTLSFLLDAIDGKVGHSELFFSIERNLDVIGALLGKRNPYYEKTFSEIFESFPKALLKAFPHLSRRDMALYLSGSSVDMHVTAFLPKDARASPQSIRDACESSCSDIPIRLTYWSGSDGWGSEGIRQNFLSDVFDADFLNHAYVLTNLITGEARFGERNELFESSAKNAIVADTDGGKLYVNGERANSQQFLSQQFTADVLSMLAHVPGRGVKSTDLPFSGYSESVSEFSGKILTPLKKTFREISGAELPIECVGSNPFSIRMKKTHPFGWIFTIGRLAVR